MKKTIAIAVVSLSIFSCKTAKIQEAVEGKTWELFAINGVEANMDDFNRGLPTATFAADKSVSGHSGCNTYRGTYTLDSKGALAVDKVISTKMYCEGDGENNFMRAFANADKAVFEDEKLKLFDGSEEVLVFVPKAD